MLVILLIIKRCVNIFKGLEQKNWQEILSIHTKLEWLSSRYSCIVKSVASYEQHLQPSSYQTETACSSTKQGASLCSSEDTSGTLDSKFPSVLNSLQEWQSLVKLKCLIEHKQWELDFLRDLEHLIMPLLSQASQELESSSELATQNKALIRALHLLFDLPPRAV